MPTCYDMTGKRLELHDNNRIGKGGEGTVYVHPKDDNWAIKIYRPEKLDAQRREKIEAICRAQYHAKVEDVLFPILPIYSTRRRKTADIIGFTMQRAKGPYGSLYALMHPKERQCSFPAFTLRDNILVAQRMLRIVHRLHQHKIVIGDINARGFLIRQMAGDGQKMGHVLLIDADSLQIPANGKVYYCTVGVGDYTPPELQGRKLSRGILRAPESDRFGMAVLLFQLMHDGLHPFAGYHQGNRITYEEAIKHKLYAHAPNNGMRPTRSRIIPAHYPQEIQDAFMRAFTGEPDERPTPREWNRLLSGLKLKDCGNGHHYPPGANYCPWCGKSHNAGRPHVSTSSSTTKGGGGAGATNSTTGTGTKPGTTSSKRSYNYSIQSGNDIPWGAIIMVLVSLYLIYKGINTVVGWVMGSDTPASSPGIARTSSQSQPASPKSAVRTTSNRKCIFLAKRARTVVERSQQYDCDRQEDFSNNVFMVCQEQGYQRALNLLKQTEVDVKSCANRKEREARRQLEERKRRLASCRTTVRSARKMAELLRSMWCGPSRTYNWSGIYENCLRDTSLAERLLRDLRDTHARCVAERNQRNRTYAAPSAPTSNASRGVDTWDDYRNGSQRGYGNSYGYDDSQSRRSPPPPKPRYIARWLRRDGHRATAWSATNKRGCLLKSACNCPGKANNCGFYRPGATALFWPFGCRKAAVIAICQVRRAR